MRVLFFAFYNTINEIAYKAMKEQGVNTLPYLRKKVMQINVYFLYMNFY